MEDCLKNYINTNNFKSLRAYYDGKKFSHALIITSEDAFTNYILAKLYAMLILCKNKLCFKCDDCVKILQGTHPDLVILPEKEDFLVADANKCVESSTVKPILADKKVFILNNFDKATIQSQNKLLKTIEEPPANVFFIITAKSLENVLPTIISRTQTFEVSRFSNEEMLSFLKGDDDDIVYLASNWPGKMISLQEDRSLFSDYAFVKNMLRNLTGSKDVAQYSTQLAENKNTFVQKLALMQDIFRDTLMIKYGKNTLVKHKIDLINDLASIYSSEAIIKTIECIDQANTQFNSNVNVNLIADNLLLTIMEVKFLCK